MFDRALCVRAGVAGPAPVVRPGTARYAGRTEGFVSGIRAHTIANATHPTRAMTRKPPAWPSVCAIRPKSVVLIEAPTPDTAPTRP